MIRFLHPSTVVATLRRRGVFSIALLAFLVAAFYWSVLASDRYVSQARVVIQRTDIGAGQAVDFSALLGAGGGGSRGDQLLLRDHLLSMDMLAKLEEKLGLRAHFSDRQHDVLSRLTPEASMEDFFAYYLSRVDVAYDDYSGVLVIKSQAFDAKTAQAMTALLVEEGEQAMNDLAHRLARDQVAFVEKQTSELGERLRQARQEVVAYQNKKGLVSPQGTAEALNAIVGHLEGSRSELQIKRSALLGYLAPTAPAVVELDLQIGAIDKQLATEKGRLAANGGKTLNATVEEYQRLEMSAQFAQDVYKTALIALEKARIEATRNIKKVSVVQRPTLPQAAEQPRRAYNILLFALVALITAGIAHLLAAIARDHKD